jgi:hypothetical protein
LRIVGILKSLLFAFSVMTKDNNQMEHKAITLAHKPLIVYIITALMVATSLLYFYVAYEDYQELLQATSSSSADSKDSTAAAASSAEDIQATRNEMTFFLIVAISYIPISIWMLKVKHRSKIPYIIAIAGSAALIAFYILTRMMDIPSIGLQTDVGTTDIAVKIIQGAIVAISSFLVVSTILRRNRLENNLENINRRKDSTTKERKNQRK